MRRLHVALSVPSFLLIPLLFSVEDTIDFNRDIRPIISDKCFQCHGPDAENQKSEFRLDSQESATANLGGVFGIVPGNLEESELHWRIWEEFEEDVMPPVSSKLSLTEEEKHMLDRWIEQGAAYDKHWSFKPIESPELPDLSSENKSWSKNEIDHFIAQRLDSESLSPSESADKETLIRRLSFDLTGLPPTIEEIDAFLVDEDINAYERLVDRLIASPHYGERMALAWLDAARYADSGGYQDDIKRSQWPWRDWVIEAYNANMPFDQFTIEQLGGDLLDNPTSNQILATAFNRNHRINNEGGIIPEEFLVEYVADRVETASTVFLGLTMACARCHDHKYDPLTQADFYSLFAFFNNIAENGRDGNIAPVPNMNYYNGGTLAEHEHLKQELAAVKHKMNDVLASGEAEFSKWLSELDTDNKSIFFTLRQFPKPSIHIPFETVDRQQTADVASNRKVRLSNRKRNYKFLKETEFSNALSFDISTYAQLGSPHPDGYYSEVPRSWHVNFQSPKNFAGSEGPLLALVQGEVIRGYRLILEQTADPENYRASFQIIDDASEKRVIEVVSKSVFPKGGWAKLGVAWDGSGKATGVSFYLNGQPIETETLLDNLQGNFDSVGNLLIGARSAKDAQDTLRDATFRSGLIEDVQIYDFALDASQMKILSDSDSKLKLLANGNKASREVLKTHWFKESSIAQQLGEEERRRERALVQFEDKHVVQVSIMEEMDTPRDTYFLDRGAYDQPDKDRKLSPRVPAALPQMDSSLPRNRLGLAKWLIDPKNPLTARVAVNRYWQMYFGVGLVETPEDFGSQGALPSHPELLDWLASEFRESGWNIKEMQKRIVMSSTYRQSSRISKQALERDPKNLLLARGPRFRLNGQALRDQAITVSGLMATKIGGPPVMPYQPKGLWEEVNAKGYKYIVGSGEDLYRRSIYTFWRRTVPPPSMMNFDNASREICSVKYNSTNTPLQALNLLNDPQFFEAARGLAQRMILEGGSSLGDRIDYGYRLALSHSPSKDVLSILESSYAKHFQFYRSSPERTKSLISVGSSQPDRSVDPTQLAAMTMIANTLLNLDETVTKQ